MINTAEIEAGDKVHLRDGSVLVVTSILHQGCSAGGWLLGCKWHRDGRCEDGKETALDIIRIEKAPKPVVRELYISVSDNRLASSFVPVEIISEKSENYKITITDGVLVGERVK